MTGHSWDVVKLIARALFVALVMAIIAENFDQTELFVLGFLLLFDGAMVWWEHIR